MHRRPHLQQARKRRSHRPNLYALSLLMNPYTYPILEAENYDGDSMNLTLDLGFGLVIHKKCRLHGVDTPELRDKRSDFQKAAKLAKTYVRAFLQLESLFFVSENYTGKFGRPLGDIVRISDDGLQLSLRAELIKSSLGVPYHGQAKAELEGAHRANIKKLHIR